MANEAATKGDELKGNAATMHNWTNPGANTMESTACSFKATINSAVSANVFINGKEAATVDSVAQVPTAPEARTTDWTVDIAASDKATITGGSSTVFINGKGAARNGDAVKACSSGGKVVVSGSANVFIGG